MWCSLRRVIKMSSDSDPEMFAFNLEESWDPFDYQDPLLTPPLTRAVLTANIDEVKALLESGKSVNSADNNGNVPLHLAVIYNRKEILDLLLSCPDLNLEATNFMSYTALLGGLHAAKAQAGVIMRLLQANCNVNVINCLKETPLHLAVTYYYPENVLCEMIKRGADVNAQDDDNLTALHRAVHQDNLPALHLLLYYGADVNILSSANMNPLMYAVKGSYEIARILFDFYDDFSCVSKGGYNALYLAAESRNQIAVDLVKAGMDVNYVVIGDQHLIYYSLFYPNADFFKEIWQRVDYEEISYSPSQLLDTFIDYCRFPTSQFLECLFLMLNSSCIMDLLNPPVDDLPVIAREYLLSKLLRSFHRRSVEKNTRLDIINIVLSYGYKAQVQDVVATYDLYGISEELTALIHAGCFCGAHCTIKNAPLLSFIFVLEGDYTNKKITKMINEQITAYSAAKHKAIAKSNILYTLGFFSVPPEDKQTLINANLSCEISDRLLTVPEFPSLLELSRNQTRKFIMQSYKVEYTYQFYDLVERLHVPDIIKQIITFKKPLYI